MDVKQQPGDRDERNDRDPGPPDLSEDQAADIDARLHLTAGLNAVSGDTGMRHFDLEELVDLADARRRQAGEWEMPGHLAECPVCLELFQALMEGVPQASPQALSRFAGLWKADGPPRLIRFTGSRWRILRVAAAILILLAAGTAYRYWTMTAGNAPVLQTGALILANGDAATIGSRLPEEQKVTVKEDTALVLNDGTTLHAVRQTVLAIPRSPRDVSTVFVHDGEMAFDVAKQKAGRSFCVRTQLGDIRVIGTRFRVMVGAEPVVVHETEAGATHVRSYDGSVSRVEVRVAEGVVSVRNGREEVFVSAGQTAVMRQNLPRIEVRK